MAISHYFVGFINACLRFISYASIIYSMTAPLFEQFESPSSSMFPTKFNTFRPVVYEKKIFEDLSKFSLFCTLLGFHIRGFIFHFDAFSIFYVRKSR